jgi:hypothetical protein
MIAYFLQDSQRFFSIGQRSYSRVGGNPNRTMKYLFLQWILAPIHFNWERAGMIQGDLSCTEKRFRTTFCLLKSFYPLLRFWGRLSTFHKPCLWGLYA